MTDRVWITRTVPGAIDSAAAWIGAGATVILSPILHVRPVATMPMAPPPGSTLIFTSRNGVDAFAAGHAGRDYRVVTVGDATAARARARGFADVASADGTSRDVVALISGRTEADMRYTHCSGRHVRGTITEDLRTAGRDARRDVYYGSVPAKAWPPVTAARISHVALYSPLAAQTFARFAAGRDLSHMTTLSISPATDALLQDLRLAGRRTADAPNEAAMLDLL